MFDLVLNLLHGGFFLVEYLVDLRCVYFSLFLHECFSFSLSLLLRELSSHIVFAFLTFSVLLFWDKLFAVFVNESWAVERTLSE